MVVTLHQFFDIGIAAKSAINPPDHLVPPYLREREACLKELNRRQ
jgi:hypothetical protein